MLIRILLFSRVPKSLHFLTPSASMGKLISRWGSFGHPSERMQSHWSVGWAYGSIYPEYIIKTICFRIWLFFLALTSGEVGFGLGGLQEAFLIVRRVLRRHHDLHRTLTECTLPNAHFFVFPSPSECVTPPGCPKRAWTGSCPTLRSRHPPDATRTYLHHLESASFCGYSYLPDKVLITLRPERVLIEMSALVFWRSTRLFLCSRNSSCVIT